MTKNPMQKCKRIDPVDAAIDAHTMRMKSKEDSVDIENEMQKYLERMGWK